MTLRRHVVLVGLPGSGKTAVGRALAIRLAVPFRDVDAIVETEAGMSIRQIFADLGEGAFRSMETRIVTRLLGSPPAVIASGGGWAAQPGNLETAREVDAYLIYLRCSPEIAAQRTADDLSRPLLATGDPLAVLRELLAARESYYLQSDLVVQTGDRRATDVVEELVSLVPRGTGARRQRGTT